MYTSYFIIWKVEVEGRGWVEDEPWVFYLDLTMVQHFNNGQLLIAFIVL